MANPVGTFQTYQAIGDREDLSNMIYNISPTETPFVSMAKRRKAAHTKFEWQTDALSAAAANSQVEGDTPSNTTVTPTTRLFNYTQILSKTFNISGTQQAVNPAGRADDLAYQLVKRGKEVKRDLEKAMTGNTANAVGTSGTARVSGSLEAWMSSNWTTSGVSVGASASTGFSAGGGVEAAIDNTVQGTLSEANVKAIIRACWTAGGEPKVIMTGPFNKVKVSGFSGILTNNINQSASGQAQIIAAADSYVSDFGALKVVPNRFNRDQTVTILDMEFWALAYLRPFQQVSLAKVGDSDQRMILVEVGLESKNQAASGKVTDCTTA
jgi:uncharacterized protein DUF5309